MSEKMTAGSSPRFVNPGNFMRMERYEDAEGLDFAIYGIPFDTAASYRTGARFGPQAIRNISVMLKSINPVHQVDIFEHLKGGDLGDVNIVPGYIHPTYDAIEEFTAGIIKAGAVPIALGGDHSITLPELRAAAEEHGPVSLLQFDAHADLNDEVFGEKYSHGTPFRRAMEEGLIDPTTSVQIGMRGSIYEADEFEMARNFGFTLIPGHDVHERGLADVLAEAKEVLGGSKVFLTFDIDFVDPAYAPGTGTPEVGGFNSQEAVEIIRNLKGLNFVGMDIVEVSPMYDAAEITSLLAAHIVFEFLSILAAEKKEKEEN